MRDCEGIEIVGGRKSEPTRRRPPLATRIRQARRAAGLSQSQVAELLGLQRPSVTEMESGNRRVSSDEIVELARLFEVSPQWLLGVEGNDADEHLAKAQLAARELTKLKPADLDRLLELLSSMRREEDE